MSQQVTINETKNPNIILRFLWFLFVGWYVGIGVLVVALVCAITIIGIPLAMFLIDRLPTIMTLRARTRQIKVTEDNQGKLKTREGGLKQTNIVLRVVYFIFDG